jgi:hypothetical protein
MGAKQAHALIELLIGGRDHATLAHAELLLGEEAEATELTDGADLTTDVIYVCAYGLSTVLDQNKPALVAELSQSKHVGRVATEVNSDDGTCARRDSARDILWIDIERVGALNVTQDRLGSDMPSGTGACDKGKSRHDYLIAGTDPCRKAGQMQGGCAA